MNELKALACQRILYSNRAGMTLAKEWRSKRLGYMIVDTKIYIFEVLLYNILYNKVNKIELLVEITFINHNS